MDLIALYKPPIIKLRSINVRYDKESNEILLEYQNNITMYRFYRLFNVPSTLSGVPSFYLVYNVITDEYNFLPTLSTFGVTDRTVNVNGQTYDIDKVIVVRIDKYDAISGSGGSGVDLSDITNRLDNLLSQYSTLSNQMNQLVTTVQNLSNTYTFLNNNVNSLAQSYQNLNASLSFTLSDNTGLSYSSFTYVSDSFPITANHNDIVWRTDERKLYKYDSVANQWVEINWQIIAQSSPEWKAGRLRINSDTGDLQISPNGTNWYNCIPAVGSDIIQLGVIDNISFSYKYWIPPNQTVVLNNVNHIPIVYSRAAYPRFRYRILNIYYGLSLSLSNTTSNGHTYIAYRDSYNNLHYVSYNGIMIGRGLRLNGFSFIDGVIMLTEKLRWGQAGGSYLDRDVYFSSYSFDSPFITPFYSDLYFYVSYGFGYSPSTSYWLGVLRTVESNDPWTVPKFVLKRETDDADWVF